MPTVRRGLNPATCSCPKRPTCTRATASPWPQARTCRWVRCSVVTASGKIQADRPGPPRTARRSPPACCCRTATPRWPTVMTASSSRATPSSPTTHCKWPDEAITAAAEKTRPLLGSGAGRLVRHRSLTMQNLENPAFSMSALTAAINIRPTTTTVWPRWGCSSRPQLPDHRRAAERRADLAADDAPWFARHGRRTRATRNVRLFGAPSRTMTWCCRRSVRHPRLRFGNRTETVAGVMAQHLRDDAQQARDHPGAPADRRA